MTHDGNEAMTGRTGDGDAQRESRWRIAAWAAAAIALLVPLVAMQLSDEVNWSGADFALAAACILAVGVPLDLAVRKTGSAAYRWALALAVAGAVLLVWTNGAVGIIGSEESDVNVLFFGVIAVGVVGALVARSRPWGMALAMAATALAQASVAIGALVAGLVSPVDDRFEIVALWVFVAVWAASAALFRRAAREQAPSGGAPVG